MVQYVLFTASRRQTNLYALLGKRQRTVERTFDMPHTYGLEAFLRRIFVQCKYLH